jgi:hypothetical protein
VVLSSQFLGLFFAFGLSNLSVQSGTRLPYVNGPITPGLINIVPITPGPITIESVTPGTLTPGIDGAITPEFFPSLHVSLSLFDGPFVFLVLAGDESVGVIGLRSCGEVQVQADKRK